MELRTGRLAYYVTIHGGLIPCKVNSIVGTSGEPSTAQRIVVTVTADRPGAWKRGEVLDTLGVNVIPRESVHWSRGRWHHGAFTVVADA